MSHETLDAFLGNWDSYQANSLVPNDLVLSRSVPYSMSLDPLDAATTSWDSKQATSETSLADAIHLDFDNKLKVDEKQVKSERATTFQVFPLLATELRLKIWDEARKLFPRICSLAESSDQINPQGVRIIEVDYTGPTPLLATNHEARDIVRKARTQIIGLPSSWGSTNSFTFDFDMDIIYIRRLCLPITISVPHIFRAIFGNHSDVVTKKLRHLMVTDPYWTVMYGDPNLGSITKLESLETFGRVEDDRGRTDARLLGISEYVSFGGVITVHEMLRKPMEERMEKVKKVSKEWKNPEIKMYLAERYI